MEEKIGKRINVDRVEEAIGHRRADRRGRLPVLLDHAQRRGQRQGRRRTGRGGRRGERAAPLVRPRAAAGRQGDRRRSAVRRVIWELRIDGGGPEGRRRVQELAEVRRHRRPTLDDAATAAGVRVADRGQRVLRRGRVRPGHGRPGGDRQAAAAGRPPPGRYGAALARTVLPALRRAARHHDHRAADRLPGRAGAGAAFAPAARGRSAATRTDGVDHVPRAGAGDADLDALRRAGAEERRARPADAVGAATAGPMRTFSRMFALADPGAQRLGELAGPPARRRAAGGVGQCPFAGGARPARRHLRAGRRAARGDRGAAAAHDPVR